ncbi:MAG: hypothetical protein IH993_07835 [Proteobacteria bacterium]|nr:hypothetical protein [Pseudomonadota bacterium]
MADENEPTENAIVTTNEQPLALIEGSPSQVVERATEMANELRKVINHQHLYADIRGKQYVTVEGWTTLGAMVGAVAWAQVAAFWAPLGLPALWNTISVIGIAAVAGGFGFWQGFAGRPLSSRYG